MLSPNATGHCGLKRWSIPLIDKLAAVFLDMVDCSVIKDQINSFRTEIAAARSTNRTGGNWGGTLAGLSSTSFLAEIGLTPPRPYWRTGPYTLHAHIPYAQEWYKTMVEKQGTRLIGGLNLHERAQIR